MVRKQKKSPADWRLISVSVGEAGAPTVPPNLGRTRRIRARGLQGFGSNPRKIWATREKLAVHIVSWLGQTPRVQYFYLLDFTLQGNQTGRLP